MKVRVVEGTYSHKLALWLQPKPVGFEFINLDLPVELRTSLGSLILRKVVISLGKRGTRRAVYQLAHPVEVLLIEAGIPKANLKAIREETPPGILHLQSVMLGLGR